MLRRLVVGVCAVALSAVPCAPAAPLVEDAKAFGMREDVHSMTISPSGTKVAMLLSGPQSETVLSLADLTNGSITHLTKSDGRPQQLRWCGFAGESNLVCRNSGIEPFQNQLLGFSSLFTIRADGSGMKQLGQRASARDRFLRQTDGTVIDWLPGQDGAVLIQRQYIPEVGTTGRLISRVKDGIGVDRFDLQSLKVVQVEPPRAGISHYLTDDRGNVRMQIFAVSDKNSGLLTGRSLVQYRTGDSRTWVELGEYDSRTENGFYPLAVDGGSDSVYALKKLNGRDALYKVRLDGSKASTLVASDKSVDIDGVVRLGTGQRVIGYTYADERRRTVYFDPELAALQAALARGVGGDPAISFHGASSDGQKILVLVSGDTNPGTFYRFDKATSKLEEIAPLRAAMADRTLSPVKAIRVAASDGASIPAYLTLPAGSSGKNLPAVVLPHGGPSARDEWGFDWLPQFLAARGYVVIQPNYRGSAGYGEEWLAENGFRGWRTSIGDVTAAAKYLVSQGIADPQRLAIVGWSYGGYAALQSAAVEPGLYKAAVAIAPVTDLAMLRRQQEGFTNARLAQDFIGTGPHLTEGSPLRKAAAINVPVLLVHGDNDANVLIAQSERMHEALKSSGKPVEFLRFAGLDHGLDDSSARTEMLTRIGSLLERTIGK